MDATCHCGSIRISVASAPDHLTICNCTLCTKLGTRWVYAAPAQVVVEAPADGLARYVREDMDEPALANFRCAKCGCPTHWRLIGDAPGDRMGINANLIEPEALDGLEVRRVDGRSWPLS